MGRFLGLLLAAGLTLGLASSARAQVMLSVGNPYSGLGMGLSVGYPYGYAYGNNPYNSLMSPYSVTSVMPAPATFYSSGYSGVSTYVAPGTSYFASGTYRAYPLGYGIYPAYGYGVPVYGYYRPYYGLFGGGLLNRVLGPRF
jgi:hypothetical protein